MTFTPPCDVLFFHIHSLSRCQRLNSQWENPLKLILKYLKCILSIGTLFSCILILFDKKKINLNFRPCLKYILSVVKLYFIKRKTSLVNLQYILFNKYD